MGYAIDRPFFVCVDNKNGEVALGKEFANKMVTVVGYPRAGRNKKNKYCRTPEEVIEAYKESKTTPLDTSDCIKEESSSNVKH